MKILSNMHTVENMLEEHTTKNFTRMKVKY